jgi:hypothetical protein
MLLALALTPPNGRTGQRDEGPRQRSRQAAVRSGWRVGRGPGAAGRCRGDPGPPPDRRRGSPQQAWPAARCRGLGAAGRPCSPPVARPTDRCCSPRPIAPTALSDSASAMANEYLCRSASWPRCRWIHSRACWAVGWAGRLPMRGMYGSSPNSTARCASSSRNARSTTEPWVGGVVGLDGSCAVMGRLSLWSASRAAQKSHAHAAMCCLVRRWIAPVYLRRRRSADWVMEVSTECSTFA